MAQDCFTVRLVKNFKSQPKFHDEIFQRGPLKRMIFIITSCDENNRIKQSCKISFMLHAQTPARSGSMHLVNRKMFEKRRGTGICFTSFCVKDIKNSRNLKLSSFPSLVKKCQKKERKTVVKGKK